MPIFKCWFADDVSTTPQDVTRESAQQAAEYFATTQLTSEAWEREENQIGVVVEHGDDLVVYKSLIRATGADVEARS